MNLNLNKFRSTMMKLRLRSEESDETIIIEVPDECTLQNLKLTILQTLDSSSPADSLHLSLNRNDEIQESSSENLLRSLGINSGDLVFFTFNPSGFSNQEGTSIESSSKVEEKQIERFLSINFDPIGVVKKNCFRSTFLRKVMKQGGFGRNARKFLVTVVHSELLESGFSPMDRIDMPGDWSSTSFLMSIRYASSRLNTKDEVILLKFQCSEHFVMAYGFVSCIGESKFYSVSLDERTFPPNLDSITDETEAKNIERKVLEFWKTVEDSLAVPLSNDLEETRMFHPPSFFLLPYDMKLVIFMALSGIDIAKLQCVCVELYNLASNDGLWKMKCKKEFPLWGVSVPEDGLWKKRFSAYYMHKMLRLYGGGSDVWQDFIVHADRLQFGEGEGDEYWI